MLLNFTDRLELLDLLYQAQTNANNVQDLTGVQPRQQKHLAQISRFQTMLRPPKQPVCACCHADCHTDDYCPTCNTYVCHSCTQPDKYHHMAGGEHLLPTEPKPTPTRSEPCSS